MKTKYADIKRTKQFKYLGEIQTPSIKEKAVIEKRAEKDGDSIQTLSADL